MILWKRYYDIYHLEDGYQGTVNNTKDYYCLLYGKSYIYNIYDIESRAVNGIILIDCIAYNKGNYDLDIIAGEPAPKESL